MNSPTEAVERKDAPDGKAWKKLPVTFRDRLHELTGAQLKVWISYLTHSNEEHGGLAWPGLKALARETGLYDDYISQVRGELIENGWLISKGVIRKSDGTFSGAPAFVPVIPEPGCEKPIPEKVRLRRKSGTGKSRRTVTGEFTATDTGKSPVRSRTKEVNKREVEPSLPHIPLRGGVVGWMVSAFADRTYGSLFYTEDEADGVEALVEEHGEQNIRDAFTAFMERDGGFKDAKRPLSLFFRSLPGIAESLRVLRDHGLNPDGTHP